MTYSYSQLEQLWINAGGSSAAAPVAAAIALAESAGNPNAVNPSDNGGTQTSWGLWQISNGTHSAPGANILSATANAAAAVAKYMAAGNSFSPWGTYTSGAYAAFLSGGTTPNPNVPGGAGTAGAGTAGAGGSTGTAALTSATTQAQSCLVGFSTSSVLGLFGGSQVCLLEKSQARALIGALVLAAGGVLLGLGLAVLAAQGIGHSGPAQQAAAVLSRVPGPGEAAAGVMRRAAGRP